MQKHIRHIGIIVEPYETAEPSGLAYVTVEYTRGLIALNGDARVTVYSKHPFGLFPLPAHARNVIVPKSLLGKNCYFLKQYLFARHELPDVLVFNMPLLPFFLPKALKTVIFCHEVLFESDISGLFSRMRNFIWRLLAYRTVSAATVVCTATHATAKEVSETYGITEADIRVIPHGIRTLPEDIAPKKDFGVPYFIFTGRTKYKKNMHGIIEAFLRFKERTGSPHMLCLAGRTKNTPYLMYWLSEARHRGYGDAIVRTGYLPEPELLSVLKGADALVFCSLAEGFGLPVAEAMSMGVPVITSAIPVLAEVAGDAALLVDPEDPDAIARAMTAIAGDAALRKELSRKGCVRASQFTWPNAQRALQGAVNSAFTL